MTIIGIWDLRGTEEQNRIVEEALRVCDFPFDRLAASLSREGKRYITVSWRDLSRESESPDGQAHAIVREVEGRERVLGLFYLPPNTSIVLDSSLVQYPLLAKEVFLAEGAHAVDYHFMTNEHRRTLWNALHIDTEDLREGVLIPESGDLHHGHSWFDGPLGYNTWVGEAWMEAFVKAFSTGIPVTVTLEHPVLPGAREVIRSAFLGSPKQPPTKEKRVFSTKNSKIYHDDHKGIAQYRWFESAEAARSEGKLACKVCKPS